MLAGACSVAPARVFQGLGKMRLRNVLWSSLVIISTEYCFNFGTEINGNVVFALERLSSTYTGS